MLNKLTVNTNYYLDEFAKINYIETRLGGKTDNNIALYLDASNSFYLKTTNALFKYIIT